MIAGLFTEEERKSIPMAVTDSDVEQTNHALVALYRGEVGAVLAYDWALGQGVPQRAELAAIRDKHHACQTLLLVRLRKAGVEPPEGMIPWAEAIVARIGGMDIANVRHGLLACERSAWRACLEAFERVTCETRCFLEDEIQSRLEESLSQMSLLCDGSETP